MSALPRYKSVPILQLHSSQLPSRVNLASLATLRLKSIVANMGGAPVEEHLVIILPFPRPDAVIERIQRNHPHIRVSFHYLPFGTTLWTGESEIPPGNLQVTFLLFLQATCVTRCTRVEMSHTTDINNAPFYPLPRFHAVCVFAWGLMIL